MECNSEDLNKLIIHCVRNRPELWDLKNPQYKNIIVKKKLWCEVAQELNMSGMYCLKYIYSVSIRKIIIYFLILIKDH